MFNSGLLKEFAAKQMQKQMEKQMAEQAMMQEQAMLSNPVYQVGGIKSINDRRRQKVLLNLASQFFDSDNEMQVSPVEFISYLSEQQVSPEEILGIFRYFGQDDAMVSDLIGSVFGQSPQEYVDFDSVASAKYGGKLKRKLRKAQKGKWKTDLTNRMEGFEDPSDVTVVYDGDDRYESIFDPAYRAAVRKRQQDIANLEGAKDLYNKVWYTDYPKTTFTTADERRAWVKANPEWQKAKAILEQFGDAPAGVNVPVTNAAGLVYDAPRYNPNVDMSSVYPAAVSFYSSGLPEDIDEAQFRQWVNTYYPQYAAANEIGLNVPSTRNNRYIRSAWYELGDQYRPIAVEPVEEAIIVEETPSPIIEKKGYETKPLEIKKQNITKDYRWDDTLKMHVLDEKVKGVDSTGVDIGGRTITKKYGGNNINNNTMKKNFYGQIVNAMRNGGLPKAQNGGENEYYIPRLPIKEYDDTTQYHALNRPYNEFDMSTQLYALDRPYDMSNMFSNYGPPRRRLRNRMSGFMDNVKHGYYQALDRMGFNPYNREYPDFIDSYDRDSPFYQEVYQGDDMRNNFVYNPDDYYERSISRRAEPLPKAYQDELMREVIRNLYNKR